MALFGLWDVLFFLLYCIIVRIDGVLSAPLEREAVRNFCLWLWLLRFRCSGGTIHAPSLSAPRRPTSASPKKTAHMRTHPCTHRKEVAGEQPTIEHSSHQDYPPFLFSHTLSNITLTITITIPISHHDLKTISAITITITVAVVI